MSEPSSKKEGKKISPRAEQAQQAKKHNRDISDNIYYNIPQEKQVIHLIHFSRITQTIGTPLNIKWSDLIARYYKQPITIKATNEEIAAHSDRLKDAGGFLFGKTEGNRKTKKSIQTRTALNFDIDSFEDSYQFAKLVESIESFEFNYVFHSTFKSTPANPRCRLVIPLAEPITDVSIFRAICQNFARKYLSDVEIDQASFLIQQVMYIPVVPEQRKDDYILYYQDNDKFFNYRSIAPDLQQLHEQEEIETLKNKISTLDSTAIPGIRGAFNRYVTPEKLLETLYSDRYEKAGFGRYHLIGAHSGPGVVILDDQYIYSHHTNNDPLSDGKAHDAYDTFRILSAAGDDKKARILLKQNKKFMVFWKSKQNIPVEIPLEFYNDAGHLVCDPSLYTWLIENDTNLKGTIGYNEREFVITPLGSLPWREVNPQDDTWQDADTSRLIVYLNRRYKVFNERAVRIALVETAHKHIFNPLKSLIESKPWDGVPRLDTYFIDYLELPDTPYHRMVARLFIIGIIFRTYDPGKRFAFVPVICGPEGAGKSSILRRLAFDRYFIGDLEDYNSKDTKMKYRLAMIVEDSEGRAFKKSQSEDVKAAISETVDAFRPPYSSSVIKAPRHCVFAMTTNQTDDILPEIGKNRRYLPIECHENNVLGRIDADPEQVIPDEVVQQILAEGLERYRKGERPVMSAEEQNLADKERNKYKKSSDLTLVIEDIVSHRWISKDYYKQSLEKRRSYVYNVDGKMNLQQYICSREIQDILNNCPERYENLERTPQLINKSLEALGWIRMKTPRKIDAFYGSQRYSKRPESSFPGENPNMPEKLAKKIGESYLRAKEVDSLESDSLVLSYLEAGGKSLSAEDGEQLIQDLEELIHGKK